MTIKNETETIDAVEWADERFEKLNFGEFVKNIRLSDGVSQSELARKISVSRQFLNAVEHEKTPGNIDLAIDIAKALGYPEFLFLEVCINDLFRRKGVSGTVKVKLKNNNAA